MPIDLHQLYAILSRVAAEQRRPIYYSELSQAYADRTGEFHEPHGTWDEPLGELNRNLHAHGLPALSAVVVLKATDRPGRAFWGSSPNVPANPSEDEYIRILTAIYAARWPATLP